MAADKYGLQDLSHAVQRHQFYWRGKFLAVNSRFIGKGYWLTVSTRRLRFRLGFVYELHGDRHFGFHLTHYRWLGL